MNGDRIDDIVRIHADLLLLDGNPLLDIGITRRIRAVVLSGRLVSRSTLDSLLKSVEREAKGSPK